MSIKNLKSLAKDSVVYGLSSVITKMITVFLVPVYTRIFSPNDYGIINIINTTFFLVALFCVFGMDSSAARWFYDSDSDEDKKTTIATWFWFQFFTSVVFGAVFFMLIPFAGKYLFNKKATDVWLLWLLPCIILITDILPKIISSWFRYMRKPVATLIFTISQSLLTISLTVYFVVYLKIGLIGVFWALLISGFIFSIVAMGVMKSWLSFHYFKRDRLKVMLKYALPLIPAALAYWVLNTTDSYFLLFFKNQTEVGLFAVGSSVASCVSLFTGAFQQAWGPFAFSIHKEENARETYANVFFVFGVISSVIILFMFLFSPEILMIFTTKQYYGSAWVASILSVNLILISFTYIASIGTGIAKDNTPYSKAIFISAIMTVVLDILLIPSFGRNGSAIATLLAQLLVPAYVFYHAQKLYYIGYKFKPICLLVIFSVALGISIRLLPISDFTTFFIVKAASLLTFIFALYIIYFKDAMVLFKSVKSNSAITK